MKVQVWFGQTCPGEIEIGLLGRIGSTPIQEYAYEITDMKLKEPFKGKLLHNFNDGMWALIASIIRQAATLNPELAAAPGKRNRCQCPLCGEVVESLYRHDYRSCRCGHVFVDGGRDYQRTTPTALHMQHESELERRLRMLADTTGISVSLSSNDGNFRLQGRRNSRSFVLYNNSLEKLVGEAEARCCDIEAGRCVVGDEYGVTVLAKVRKGASMSDAKTDWRRKCWCTTIVAVNEEDACEQALDEFHDKVPIGNLDYVEITTKAVRKDVLNGKKDSSTEAS